MIVARSVLRFATVDYAHAVRVLTPSEAGVEVITLAVRDKDKDKDS